MQPDPDSQMFSVQLFPSSKNRLTRNTTPFEQLSSTVHKSPSEHSPSVSSNWHPSAILRARVSVITRRRCSTIYPSSGSTSRFRCMRLRHHMLHIQMCNGSLCPTGPAYTDSNHHSSPRPQHRFPVRLYFCLKHGDSESIPHLPCTTMPSSSGTQAPHSPFPAFTPAATQTPSMTQNPSSTTGATPSPTGASFVQLSPSSQVYGVRHLPFRRLVIELYGFPSLHGEPTGHSGADSSASGSVSWRTSPSAGTPSVVSGSSLQRPILVSCIQREEPSLHSITLGNTLLGYAHRSPVLSHPITKKAAKQSRISFQSFSFHPPENGISADSINGLKVSSRTTPSGIPSIAERSIAGKENTDPLLSTNPEGGDQLRLDQRRQGFCKRCLVRSVNSKSRSVCWIFLIVRPNCCPVGPLTTSNRASPMNET